MRRLAVISLVVAVALPLAGCADDEPVTMPDVVGKRLDIATSDVERAGFDDEVEVLGGGSFGVIDETNWTVCSQEPNGGSVISAAPRITVDRSCDAGDALDPQADDEKTSGGDATETPTEDATSAPSDKRRKKKRQPPAAVAETFIMPALVGTNLQEAQNLLQARGSFLLTQTDGTGQGRFQMLDLGWKVCGQDPAPGTETSIAKLVELITVKLSETC